MGFFLFVCFYVSYISRRGLRQGPTVALSELLAVFLLFRSLCVELCLVFGLLVFSVCLFYLHS